MDLKQIKELMAAMEKAGMKKVTLKEKTGFEIHLEMPDPFPAAASHPTFGHPPVFMPHPTYKAPDLPHPPMQQAAPAAEEHKPAHAPGKYINSPMVGTLYLAPSPEDAAFVKVGDRVEEGTVICIIEAMKVMNEVKAGMAGTVAEICLENGHPVEFGTKLFRIV